LAELPLTNSAEQLLADKTSVARCGGAIPAHFPFFTTKKPTTKMACIASSFTGSVAALKATKIQVRISVDADAARRTRGAFGETILAGAGRDGLTRDRRRNRGARGI
tara:strand:- start:218 stop:538 length:321 start_codon:yes stop_codon:yes gene_type:complete